MAFINSYDLLAPSFPYDDSSTEEIAKWWVVEPLEQYKVCIHDLKARDLSTTVSSSK